MRESLGAAIGACTGAASDLWSRVVTNTTPPVSLSAVERFAMTTIANEAVFATVNRMRNIPQRKLPTESLTISGAKTGFTNSL